MERLLLRAAKGVFLLLLGSQSVLAGSAQQQATRSVAGSALAQTQSSTSRVTSRELTVIFRDGRLTVSAKGCPLGQLLDEISSKAEVAVIATADVGTQPVSIQFKDLPLDTGLRQILENYDLFFFFAADNKPLAHLRAIWVYPKGKARGFAPVPPEQWASTKDVQRQLNDPDAGVRARAVEAIVERKRDKAQDEVNQALTDKDPQVRTRALYAALSSGVDVPEQTLTDLLFTDQSPEVRFLALDALAGSPKGVAMAELFLNDPDPHVQSRAREIFGSSSDASQSGDANKPPPHQ
jgi:HEAT repeat protein